MYFNFVFRSSVDFTKKTEDIFIQYEFVAKDNKLQRKFIRELKKYINRKLYAQNIFYTTFSFFCDRLSSDNHESESKKIGILLYS